MIITFVCWAFLVFLLTKWFKRTSKCILPPGPSALPMIGDGLRLGTQPQRLFAKWAAQYGKMFTIHFGTQPVLVLNDAKLMKELFGKMAATGKYHSEALLMISHSGRYGLLNTEGAQWIEQKEFCFRSLRQLGFGRPSTMESLFLEEAEDLCLWLKMEQFSKDGVRLKEELDLSMGLALWTLVTGDATKTRQFTFQSLANGWRHSIHIGTKSGLIFLPWLKYLAPEISGYNGLKSVCAEMQQIAEQYFDEHKMSRRREGEAPRNLIEAYIDKVENCRDPNSTFYGAEGCTVC